FTLRQHFGSLKGLRLAYLGDGNNVAHSLLEACALAGVDITVATPPGFEPDRDIVATAERLATRSGALIMTAHDPLLAVAGVDAVYTDVWLSMGDRDDEMPTRADSLHPYQVNAAVMAEAAPHAVFMHCLPAHRGDEVSADVIDGPHSLVLDEAENRMHTAQALLIALTLRLLTGAS
ncbi:MAG: ornithine carbamoyltransferase, partial [Acidimicrobiales bacterium]